MTNRACCPGSSPSFSQTYRRARAIRSAVGRRAAAGVRSSVREDRARRAAEALHTRLGSRLHPPGRLHRDRGNTTPIRADEAGAALTDPTITAYTFCRPDTELGVDLA
ncbi:DUF6233 domain-containing protein [Streptomyces sp. NPDC052101]|uniref:DUF6233 domain-containing protein n=1 Tax=Streptomyces sp. NPDC052101 TaxID=3155763 RepID=UPI0034177943